MFISQRSLLMRSFLSGKLLISVNGDMLPLYAGAYSMAVDIAYDIFWFACVGLPDT